MSPVTRSLSRLLACWLMLTSVGCATLNLSHIDLRSRKASARNPVIRVVCLWEPAEGRDPQGNPCHGFAGQILFLNRTSLPISSDGDVRVYLFDDQGTAEDQAKPLHQFDFDAGSWEQHYTYGTLGPAYNVFIPYMRKGVYEATCALRLRLTPKNGSPVFSDMTSIELMSFGGGKSTPKVPLVDPRVEETTPENLLSVNNRRRTTTISLGNGNGASGDSQDKAGTATDNQVQLAGYEAEPRPLTKEDVRIAQLEQMVKELREQQQSLAAPARPAQRPTEPPRRLDDTPDDRTKIRIRQSDDSPAERSSNQANEPTTSTRPVMRSASPAVVDRTRHHPLDDEEPATMKKARPAVHPLATDDQTPEPAPKKKLASGSRSTVRRHPLDDAFDDGPRERTATRKVIPASDASSRGDQQRESVNDPFDPIDTEAIETTTVDDRTQPRRQLRVANH